MEDTLYSLGRHMCDLPVFMNDAVAQATLRENVQQDPAQETPAVKSIFTLFSGTDVCLDSERAVFLI